MKILGPLLGLCFLGALPSFSQSHQIGTSRGTVALKSQLQNLEDKYCRAATLRDLKQLTDQATAKSLESGKAYAGKYLEAQFPELQKNLADMKAHSMSFVLIGTKKSVDLSLEDGSRIQVLFDSESSAQIKIFKNQNAKSAPALSCTAGFSQVPKAVQSHFKLLHKPNNLRPAVQDQAHYGCECIFKFTYNGATESTAVKAPCLNAKSVCRGRYTRSDISGYGGTVNCGASNFGESWGYAEITDMEDPVCTITPYQGALINKDQTN